jgi:hypothetical protein
MRVGKSDPLGTFASASTAGGASTVLEWTAIEPEEALRRSVHWHLANPPAKPEQDFERDDRALRSAA